MKKIIELEKVFNQAVADLKESFEGLKAELISVDKPELIMHDGKRLKKVEREAEEGDYVRFVKDFGHGTKLGEFYKVIEDDQYLDDKGVAFYVYGWEGEGKAVEGVYEVVYETVDRVAGIGERILVVNKSAIGEVDYKNGDVATVRSSLSTGVITEEFGEGLFHSEYEVIVEPEQVPIIKELTANQQRAELIEGAKELNEPYEDSFRFEVDEESRTVFAYSVFQEEGRYKAVSGLSVCRSDEVFNEHIEKGIAVLKALEIDVPEEFLNAVQPTKKVVGMVVDWDGRVRKIAEEAVFGETCQLGSDTEHFGKIINDTNAVYYEEELK